ncbi:MAG: hypothetical protein ACAH21_12690 [Ramlibacter sp.]|nr:hypothetical protein [Ramlibacter sp.]
MNTHAFSATATTAVANFGNTAHQVISMYRDGGERIARTLEQRWNAALKEAAPKLTPETRKNAARAQQKFSSFYARSLAMTTDGAQVVVDTLVGATVSAIERAATYAQTHKGA